MTTHSDPTGLARHAAQRRLGVELARLIALGSAWDRRQRALARRLPRGRLRVDREDIETRPGGRRGRVGLLAAAHGIDDEVNEGNEYGSERAYEVDMIDL